MKYHIGKNGLPGVCKAKGTCPLGGESEHFSTIEAAHAYSQAKMEAEYGITIPLDDDLTEEEYQDAVMTLAESGYQFEKEIEDIEYRLENEPLGFLGKARIRRRLEMIKAALVGENFTENRNLEETRKKEAIQKEDDILKANATKLSQMEYLTVPEKIKDRLLKTPYSRFKIKAYRGEDSELVKETGANSGVAMYGSGLYTTADKKYAAKYGQVREMSPEDLPAVPMRFKSIVDFEQYEYELAAEHGTNKRYLYSNGMEVEDYIMKMGFDGITIGEGKDMILVKYTSKGE